MTFNSNASDSVAEAVARAVTGPPCSPAGAMQQVGAQGRHRWRLAIWIFVCLEVGIFLLVAPWSPLWTGNLLLVYYPALRPLYMSAYLRGAISGLGLLNLWLGFREVWNFRH
ncbi:MAG: hypothetical protein ACRD88_20045 [Terriglobia bacterium]